LVVDRGDAVTIGEDLRTARNAAGWGIEELSERTRVRPHIIAGLESDDFAVCGGDCYARGHIRTLARAVGLDPRPLLERFDAEHRAHREAGVEEIFACRQPTRQAERPRVKWKLLMAMAGAVAVVAASVHVIGASPQADPDPGPDPSVRIAGAEFTAAHGSDASGEQDNGTEDESEEESEEQQADAVTLLVQAEERTWLSVSDAAGQDVFTGVLEDGEAQDYQDDEELRVSLGNAGGVVLKVNDEEQEQVGDRGEVAHITVARDGVHKES
jgi:cytoskeleton protein RodZ